MTGIDVNRGSAGVVLPPEVSGEIWQNIQEQSQIMQRTARTDLPGSGVEVEVITGDPTADWVSETDEITASKPSLGSKLMQGYKLGVVVPFSNEFRRDKAKLFGALVSRLPGVLAAKFDNTVLYGKDGAGAAPGSNFDTLFAATTCNLQTNAYANALAAISAVADDGVVSGADLNGWVVSPQGEVFLLGAVDGNQRPLFITDLQDEGSIGSVLGRPVYRSRSIYKAATASDPATVGLAGDFRYATWGQVQGVTVAVSDQATINVGGTQINLFQRDMFAVKATIEVGFRVRNIADFVRLVGDDPTP